VQAVGNHETPAGYTADLVEALPRLTRIQRKIGAPRPPDGNSHNNEPFSTIQKDPDQPVSMKGFTTLNPGGNQMSQPVEIAIRNHGIPAPDAYLISPLARLILNLRPGCRHEKDGQLVAGKYKLKW